MTFKMTSHSHLISYLTLFLVFSTPLYLADQDPKLLHRSTHKIDDSIDVSSSIGVSHSGGGPDKPKPGLVEDLLANESIENKLVKVAPPASLSHAAVVDSESDLMGSESDSRFSFSKLKRPFARLPFDLRFNTRFLNGPPPMIVSGSNMAPQIHVQPPIPQMIRQPPMRPPFQRNHQFHPNPPGPHVFNQPPAPIFKSIQTPILPATTKSHSGIPPSLIHQSIIAQPQHTSVENEPQSIAQPQPSQDPLINSIAEYLENNDDNAHRATNDIINDYDRRPELNSPSNDIWPLSQPDLAKIIQLDVKCEKNFMKVSVEFDRHFNGIIFSKGHFSQSNCIHLPAGSGRTSVYFDIRIDSCGTTGNMGSNGLVAFGSSNAGNFFENTVIFQYDPFVQEAWDQARKLRCTWHDQYEKSVSFRPFPVDMVDVVRADFAGDNVGCWMQIQVGRGPWASEVAGIVKIGQTMTMVLAIKDEENKFDMLVRNCVAHDGKRAPIELVDNNGCIVRNKLMSKFTKIKNFGSSASVLSYAHFQAFKFPDSMEVHFQCTIVICKNSCPEQCDQSGASSQSHFINHQITGTMNTHNLQNHQTIGEAIYAGNADSPVAAAQVGEAVRESVLARPREVRDVSKVQDLSEVIQAPENTNNSKEIGLNKVIRVVSTGDLSFATSDRLTASPPNEFYSNKSSNETENGAATSIISNSNSQLTQARTWFSEKINEKICMSSLNFLVFFITLLTLLLFFCTCSVVLCCRRRSLKSSLSSLGKNKKTAKEKTITGTNQCGKRKHQDQDYCGSQTVIPVMAGSHSYLSSSSVLSPRVQASNGYIMYQ